MHRVRGVRNSRQQQVARFSITLSKTDYDALQKLADENDVSLAWLVRKAVERLLASDPQMDLFRSVEVQEVVRR